MTTKASRTLMRTTTPGWYIDTADPNGPRVRKRDGDTVVEGTRPAVGNGHKPAVTSTERIKQAVAEQPPQPMVLSDTGKVLRGKTIEITCQWEGCDTKRTIKPQDAFQVKFCVPHQDEHSKQRRREKLARRRQEKAASAA